ncbi:MAG: hypothetical protein AAF349_07830, partial [Cyanobacteria bacterium P01_A01_bin.68]
QNRKKRVEVLFDNDELIQLKQNAKNSALSVYLRKVGLREKQIVNSDYEIKLKSCLAEIRYQLNQIKLSVSEGKQPSIEAINKIIQIADNL